MPDRVLHRVQHFLSVVVERMVKQIPRLVKPSVFILELKCLVLLLSRLFQGIAINVPLLHASKNHLVELIYVREIVFREQRPPGSMVDWCYRDGRGPWQRLLNFSACSCVIRPDPVELPIETTILWISTSIDARHSQAVASEPRTQVVAGWRKAPGVCYI